MRLLLKMIFAAIFVWVCFRGRSLGAKVIWFLLMMRLGNIAMSGYLLIQLFKPKSEEPLSNLVLRTAS